MKIHQVFAVEHFSDPAKLEWVRQEAEYLLKAMEADPNYVLAERFGQDMSAASLLRFFRRRERSEMTCLILRYLLSFLGHIPKRSEIGAEPVNPAQQFRAFLEYQADLLLEDDVKDAVFQEMNHGDHPHAASIWDYQEQIVYMNRRLKNMLAKEEANLAVLISNQCRVLEQIAVFWFEVRRHDLRRARRSDIFMYLLAQLVRQRCWQVAQA